MRMTQVKKKAAGAIMLLLLTSAGCGLAEVREPQPAESAAAVGAGQVELRFDDVPKQRVTALSEDETAGGVFKREWLGAGEVIFYAKRGDHEYVYGAIRTEDGLYGLGAIGSVSSMHDLSLFGVREMELSGEPVIRLDGVLGANAPLHLYASIDKGSVEPLLRVDTGHAAEIDLDGDGSSEIVAVHGTPASTHLYRASRRGWEAVSLNDALGAFSVFLLPDGGFEVLAEPGEPAAIYDYDDGRFIRRDADAP